MPIELQPLDRAALERHGESLREIVSGSTSSDALHDWIGGEADREHILANTIWGTIHWDKDLGRSAGPSLASGFDIEHFYWFETFVVTAGGGILEHKAWIPIADVAVWDLVEEADEYRVGFMCHYVLSTPPFYNKLKVELARNQHWTGASPIASGPRVIRPSEQIVEYPDGQIIALEFEVTTAIVVVPVGIGGH